MTLLCVCELAHGHHKLRILLTKQANYIIRFLFPHSFPSPTPPPPPLPSPPLPLSPAARCCLTLCVLSALTGKQCHHCKAWVGLPTKDGGRPHPPECTAVGYYAIKFSVEQYQIASTSKQSPTNTLYWGLFGHLQYEHTTGDCLGISNTNTLLGIIC